ASGAFVTQSSAIPCRPCCSSIQSDMSLTAATTRMRRMLLGRDGFEEALSEPLRLLGEHLGGDARKLGNPSQLVNGKDAPLFRQRVLLEPFAPVVARDFDEDAVCVAIAVGVKGVAPLDQEAVNLALLRRQAARSAHLRPGAVAARLRERPCVGNDDAC